jgi:septum site-determining protein MinC
MTAVRHHVTIKGVKDGLVFLLDDSCDYAEMLKELQHKLETTHQKILTGPIIHVNVKMGNRLVSDQQKDQIRGLISQRGNLLIQSIESVTDSTKRSEDALDSNIKIIKGIIRSGQSVHHDGNILYLGEVNPGGSITSTGDIYIMGSLRGMAHAGVGGNEHSIIAASHLRPTQLRIAGVISRPPDEWGIEEAFMEFAYLKDQKMEIDKIIHLHRIRPGSFEFKGV